MEIKTPVIDPAILAEQKAYKASKDSFRKAIKELSEQQGLFKLNRKTNVPDRRYSQSEAAMYHYQNRHMLRHLHIAYAVFRGKPLPERKWGYNTELGVLTQLSSVDRNDTMPNIALVEKLLKQHVSKAVSTYPV